jgi:hypothetical protein
MKYPNNPEVIATLETIDNDCNDTYIGDRIIATQVRQVKGDAGMVDIDIRDYPKRGTNLIVRIPYPELMAALASAALNAERDL